MANLNINIGLVDDQELFRNSLKMLIEDIPYHKVVVEAHNGAILLQKLENLTIKPDIILIDVRMPVMDGPATAQKITETYPLIKLAALSQNDDDCTVIKMIKAGCCSYLLKDINGPELQVALDEIHTKNSYCGDAINVNYRRLLNFANNEANVTISEREQTFLNLASSDLTYKEIASKMHCAERTVDGYRESLFQKLNVRSRVGMVMEALRRKLVSL